MEEAQLKVESNDEKLDRLISDYGPTKYNDLVRAMQWARHLRRSEEYHDKPMSDLIEISLLDVVSKKISEQEILNAVEEDLKIEQKLAEKRSEKSRPREIDEKTAAKLLADDR